MMHCSNPSAVHRVILALTVLLATMQCVSSICGVNPNPPTRDLHTVANHTFTHPGVLLNATMLKNLKVHMDSGKEPWASIFSAAKSQSYASLNYTATPRAVVECGSYDKPSFGCSDERNDAAAAYIHALLWSATGEAAHAEKSIEIMNAWSSVLVKHNNSNAPLQSGWVASVVSRAAEIMKHTYTGWTQASIAQFEHMLASAYLPLIIDGCFGYNGNWELTMAEGVMAISIFTDDSVSFNKALALWRGRVPGYFYLTSDGTTPLAPDNSNEDKDKVVENWHGQKVFAGHDGLCQETCRDLGHTQMGMAAMMNTAETALHQGINLYGEQTARITAAMEFHAKLVAKDATQPGSWLCDNNVQSLGKPGQTWEIAYNHFGNRLGLTNLTHTAAIVNVVRPTGVGLFMVDESFSHAASF
eukprot:m.170743 g.170743  ORF g.170743 m.170743 type:complete len:415 (+) comp31618_c0_seq7:2181-3425(+)